MLYFAAQSCMLNNKGMQMSTTTRGGGKGETLNLTSTKLRRTGQEQGQQCTMLSCHQHTGSTKRSYFSLMSQANFVLSENSTASTLKLSAYVIKAYFQYIQS